MNLGSILNAAALSTLFSRFTPAADATRSKYEFCKNQIHVNIQDVIDILKTVFKIN